MTSDVFLELTLCLSSVSNDLVVSWCCGLVQWAPNEVIQKIENTQTKKQKKTTKNANQYLLSQHQETPNNLELLLNNILSDSMQVQLYHAIWNVFQGPSHRIT